MTTNYVYDNANRIQTVNSATYTFDNNGNLLNDGVNTYTYDSANLLNDGVSTYTYDTANRLKTFTNATTTANYVYNGLNDRLQETVNDVTTTFTMDLNTGLTQALSDGTNAYIYSIGRIAQVNTTTEYFLGDALGSVRQLTNASGAITYAKAYDPYGVVTTTNGSSQSVYGFTGEQQDASGLTYLRSRYYSGGTGRFLTRDTWSGDVNSPTSFNHWNYADGNPVNRTDPTGFSSTNGGNFAACPPYVFGYSHYPVDISARQLIANCRAFFSPSTWSPLINCDKVNQRSRDYKPSNVYELSQDYLCERSGSEDLHFYAHDKLTQELIASILLDGVRRRFYIGYGSEMTVPEEYKFRFESEFWLALNDYYPSNIINYPELLPISHFLGSFDYFVSKINSDRVKIEIKNQTDLASGTHLAGRFPPDDQKDNPLSLEELVQTHQDLGNASALSLLRGYNDPARGPIVSILRPLSRYQTNGGLGGGIMSQTFTWTERNMDCNIRYLPWPVYLRLLDVR